MLPHASGSLSFSQESFVSVKSLFGTYAQGPKGENVGSITQPLPSNYLIFRAASESDGEVHVQLFHLVFYILACLHEFHLQLQIIKVMSPLKSISSLGRCWMDALELALNCSSLYKLTAKAGKEGDINLSSESSHILQLLQSSPLTDTELMQ